MPDTGTVTFYVIYDDGSVEEQTHADTDGAEPVLSKPGRVAGKAEYDQTLALLEEQQAIWLAETRAREDQLRKDDYGALLAAGIPEATARRITGYNGA